MKRIKKIATGLILIVFFASCHQDVKQPDEKEYQDSILKENNISIFEPELMYCYSTHPRRLSTSLRQLPDNQAQLILLYSGNHLLNSRAL